MPISLEQELKEVEAIKQRVAKGNEFYQQSRKSKTVDSLGLDKFLERNRDKAATGDIEWAKRVANHQYFTDGEKKGAKTQILNSVANELGIVGDLQPLSIFSDAKRKAPTSEELAISMGGDPNDPYFFLTNLANPVGRVAKAGAVGALALARLAPKGVATVTDFLKLEKKLYNGEQPKFDRDLWQQTKLYRGSDGEIRYWLSSADARYKAPELLETNPKIARLRAAPNGTFTKVELRLGDVIDYPEWFKAYPETEGMQTFLYLGKDGTGNLVIRNPSNLSTSGSLEKIGDNIVKSLSVHNVYSDDNVLDILIHEMEHTAQVIEGFSQGSNAKLTGEMISFVENTALYRKVAKLRLSGIDSIDDMYRSLAQEFGSKRADELVDEGGKLLHQLLIDDVADVEQAIPVMDAALAQAQGDIVHVLDYLLGKNPESAEDVLKALSDMKYTDLQELGARAYTLTDGEAGARLAEVLRRRTQAQIDALDFPPNPKYLNSVKGERLVATGKVRDPSRAPVIGQAGE